jgi:hypothetical protein
MAVTAPFIVVLCVHQVHPEFAERMKAQFSHERIAGAGVHGHITLVRGSQVIAPYNPAIG